MVKNPKIGAGAPSKFSICSSVAISDNSVEKKKKGSEFANASCVPPTAIMAEKSDRTASINVSMENKNRPGSTSDSSVPVVATEKSDRTASMNVYVEKKNRPGSSSDYSVPAVAVKNSDNTSSFTISAEKKRPGCASASSVPQIARMAKKIPTENSFSILRKRKSSEAVNDSSELVKVPKLKEVEITKSEHKSLVQVSDERIGRIKINNKHMLCWKKYLSGVQQTLAGVPHTLKCPKELRVLRSHARAFNIFFNEAGYAEKRKPGTPYYTMDYGGALKAWAAMPLSEKRERVAEARKGAFANGIFFSFELSKQEKYVKYLRRILEQGKGNPTVVSHRLSRQELELAAMIEATKLLLIGHVNGVDSALRLAPLGCRFGYANQTSKKMKMKIKAELLQRGLGKQIMTVGDFLEKNGFISSDENLWTDSGMESAFSD